MEIENSISVSDISDNCTEARLPKLPKGRSQPNIMWKRRRQSGLPIRFLQMFLLSFCSCSNHIMRANLNIGGILLTGLKGTSYAKVFNWRITESTLTQSFFFGGYLLMNLGGSLLVNKYSNKNLLLSSIWISSVISFLTPFLVNVWDYYALLIIRFILGLTQGCMMPCIMNLMTKWVPPSERCRCGAMVLGGIHLANLVSFSVFEWFDSNYGWPATFYFSGTVGIMCSILWALIGAESKDTCTIIPLVEKWYLYEKLAETSNLQKNLVIPWKDVLFSKACWAIIFATFGHSWGLWTILMEVPIFFNNAIDLPITSISYLMALPFGCMWILSFPASYVSDLIGKSEVMPTSFCRKLFNSIGHLGPAFSLAMLVFTTNKEIQTVLYIFGINMLFCADLGHGINHLDILPNFAGFLMGISNGVGVLGSIFASLVASLIIHDETNPDEWKRLFLIAAFVFVAGNTAFIVMGSTEKLDFNKIPTEFEMSNVNWKQGSSRIQGEPETKAQDKEVKICN